MKAKLKCRLCGYEWYPKVKKPKQCPACKNYFYDKKRQVMLGTVKR